MGFPREAIPARRRRVGSVVAAILLLCFVWTLKFYAPLPLLGHFKGTEKTVQGNPSIASLITKNVATIVEGRPIVSLAPLLLHFASVLGPEWPIVVFTSANATLPDSEAFRRAITKREINIVDLPTDTDFKDRDSVSAFFTAPWFWEQLAPAQHILFFQSDSIICSNSPLPIEHFLKYDFVGAPINPELGSGDEGLNGGLSLRNRTLFLETTKKHSWKDDVAYAVDPYDPRIKYEDQWFFHKLRETLNNADGEYEVKLPTTKEAGNFSIETLIFKGGRPFGYHQAARFHSGDEITEIEKYCPEFRMATTDYIKS